MGKNNKARRAAKAKKRERTERQRRESGYGEATGGPSGTPFAASRAPSALEQAARLWDEALRLPTGHHARRAALIEHLLRLPAAVVDGIGQDALLHPVAHLWRAGWQPAELAREVRRRTNALAGRLAELVVIVDHEHRSGQRLDPRWASQLQQLGQRSVSTRGGGWLATWRAAEGIDRSASYRAVLECEAAMCSLPQLEVLIPPPGAGPSVVTLGAAVRAGNQPMLERVRKLLAKAESTTFEEEAEALTAKAQALMTRHAIDEALVRSGTPSDGPRMLRLPVDAPYADAKSVLLSTIASANRCRAIYRSDVALSCVVGHDDDLATVEMLFASLLVQARQALSQAARNGSRARSQSFRASFYLAYAARIGERLAGVNEEVYAEDGSRSALPVLRAKEDAVADFVESHYGDRLTTGGVRGGYDLAGHAAGRAAADRARLDAGALVSA